jgi:small subunit ribosomal protein S11
MFSFYASWLLFFIFTNLYKLKTKTNHFLSYIYISFFNHCKLISHVININLSSTNTIININNIKGNPKLFYSAGMFGLQKKQKTRQPKAIILILRALLLKSKIFKTKPVAVHFNNLFFNHQSYIFKKLKQKIFTKLVRSYSSFPHNGCRLRKKKRIKIRTRTRKLPKEWLSGWKWQIVNLLSITYRRFESYFLLRNITQFGSVPVLGTGSHVFKSHYFDIDSIFLILSL